MRRSCPTSRSWVWGAQFAAAGWATARRLPRAGRHGADRGRLEIPQSFAVLPRLIASAHEARPAAVPWSSISRNQLPSGAWVQDLNVPVIYYVCHRSGPGARVGLKTIREVANQVLVIFPF